MPIQKDIGCHATADAAITYITDPQKTTDKAGKRWVETLNMASDGTAFPEEMYSEFCVINNFYKKNQGFEERKYYHIVLNFKNTPWVTPEMAMDIGRAYMEKYYHGHQTVMAVHVDNEGVHFHACANSLNSETGKKMKRKKMELADRKDYANEIAYELYKVPPFDWRAAVKKKREEEKEKIRSDQKKNLSSEEVSMRKTRDEEEISLYSWKERIRVAISQAAMHTTNREDFALYLKTIHGVTMNRNTEKTVSFSIEHDEKLRTIRGGKLGGCYTAENIDWWLEYNRRRKDSELLAKRDPIEPVFEIVVLRKSEYQRRREIMFREDGRPRSNLELLGILVWTVIKKPSAKVVDGRLQFRDKDGNVIYPQNATELQNLYDSIVYCRDKDFSSYEDAYQQYEKIRKELYGVRQQERSLKNSVKKMNRIEELIRKKEAFESNTAGEWTPSEFKEISSELHKAKLHTDGDIAAFRKRHEEIRVRLEEVEGKVKRTFQEKQTLMKALDHLDRAQAALSRYGFDQRSQAQEEMRLAAERESFSERARDEDGLLNLDLLLAGAKSKSEYETFLHKNGRGMDDPIIGDKSKEKQK